MLAFGLLRSRGSAFLNSNNVNGSVVELLFKESYLATHAHPADVRIRVRKLMRVECHDVGSGTRESNRCWIRVSTHGGVVLLPLVRAHRPRHMSLMSSDSP